MSLSAGLLLAAWPAAGYCYLGDSFIQIPGKTGHYRGAHHRDWIRAEASDWPGRLRRMNSGSSDFLAGEKLFFGGPNVSKPGNGGKLVVSLNKSNADTATLMALCKAGQALPELTYAESSDRARPALELGPRPKDLPAYWEYKLKDVKISGCPVVEGAEQQAFIIEFQDIAWLNYDPERPMANKIVVTPADLPKVVPAAPSPTRVKAFLITWFAPATTTTDEQCPVMNKKPNEADVLRYLSKEDAAAARAKVGEAGFTAGTQTETRGPMKLNAVLLPGIVPDPGLAEPKMTVADGIDLDGSAGGPRLPDARSHENFTSPDGRAGIDNQLIRVTGCIAGLRGRRGYSNQTPNARRADGNVTTIVEISGIDDPLNDKDVEVALIYARDKPIRDSGGKSFISNYSFRTTDDPNFTLYNIRVHGRIVNGAVMTDPIPNIQLNPGQGGLIEMFHAQMRFEPKPDGSMKGLLAGYEDWRGRAIGSGYSEGLFGFQTPALYYALKRNADGLKDPATGEYNGISVVYEMDTVPAFLTP